MPLALALVLDSLKIVKPVPIVAKDLFSLIPTDIDIGNNHRERYFLIFFSVSPTMSTLSHRTRAVRPRCAAR